MEVLVQRVFLSILPLDKGSASSHLVGTLYQFFRAGGGEVVSGSATGDLFLASSWTGKGKRTTDGEMGCDDVIIRPDVSAVRTDILSTATRLLQVHAQTPSLHLFCTPSVTPHHLILAHFSRVILSCPQLSLPLASLLRVGTQNSKVSQPSLVEVVRGFSEALAIDGAVLSADNALSTEQVPTTGLHWVRDQL